MRDKEQAWLMLAVASLAGGVSSKQAAENADKLLEAMKTRFPEREDDLG